MMGPAEADLDVFPPGVRLLHRDRPDAAELPGGADQAVEPAEVRRDPGDDPLERHAVADVAGQGAGPTAGLLDCHDSGLEVLPAASDQPQSRAPRREMLRDRAAQASTPAGDQDTPRILRHR